MNRIEMICMATYKRRLTSIQNLIQLEMGDRTNLNLERDRTSSDKDHEKIDAAILASVKYEKELRDDYARKEETLMELDLNYQRQALPAADEDVRNYVLAQFRNYVLAQL
ncbi:hypothetical protein Fcan01_04402 [Folsomia candida]|uniref:Uncharacterized protein n=2 Tax=Folsomia candida TaxID=158441 RepID=A0A226EUA3_FOLCA|nr:hypothetical protein Fcan01_04402 [Folsomia candida]